MQSHRRCGACPANSRTLLLAEIRKELKHWDKRVVHSVRTSPDDRKRESCHTMPAENGNIPAANGHPLRRLPRKTRRYQEVVEPLDSLAKKLSLTKRLR